MIKIEEKDGGAEYKAYWENGVYVGDLVQDVDGFYKWWPTKGNGYIDEWFLLCMYERLKEMNKKWQDTVNNDPAISGLRNDNVQQGESI